MSITAASFKVDGTVATTGGTDRTLVLLGYDLGSVKTIVNDGAEFVAQTTINFSVKEPKVSSGAPNGYTQARNVCKVSVPKLLANGKYTINTLTMELAVDQETTDAQIQSLLVLAAQLLADSDFSSYWKQQALT